MSGLEASLLLGSLHAVALATALRRRKQHRRANQYLEALLIALALLMFDGLLRARGTLASHPHLIGLTAWVPFVLGPLVFLYVRQMTAPDQAAVPAPWRHFAVPAAYVVLLAVTFLPRSASYKLRVAKHDASWIILATEVGLLGYGIAYALASLVRLRRHREHVQALYSNLSGVSLHWLLALAVLNALVWIAALAAFVIRIGGFTEASAASAIVPIGSAITIFVIGYFQLGQGEIFHTPPPPDVAPPRPEIAAGVANEVVPPAYARARLADDDAAAVEDRLKAAMTQMRLYQRSGLTLGELADEVAATPHELSQVLSTRFQRNFYAFVNEHRIEHVKQGLSTTDRSVLDLAFEAGFKSKSTFNNAFRKATGTTPSEFRARSSR